MTSKLSHSSPQLYGNIPDMGLIQRLSSVLARRTLLTGVLLGVVMLGFLTLVQFSTPDLAGNDGYYHIKFAYLMRTEGFLPDFPWLPLTILNAREFSDHHFLYHIALIPFTFGDLRMGAKWASVVFASLAFLSVWWLLYKQRVPYAALWTLGLLAVSEAFIYRMSLARPPSLSLAILVIGLYWMLSHKYVRLIPLAFFYVWLYDAFPLLVLLVGIYTLCVWLLERRLNLYPLIYTGIGVLLGLFLKPYFPHNVIFLYRHIFPKLTETTSVGVGSEWYPYRFALGLRQRRMEVNIATSFLAAVLFGMLVFQSRHFIEYFPAFALIFAALAWSPLIIGREQRREVDKGAVPESRFKVMPGTWVSLIKRSLPVLLLILVLIPGMWITFKEAKSDLQGSKPYGLYARASAWLEANTPDRARVFQTDWDDFPRLFFYNTHNTYLVGLDPTYMQLYDAEMYELWVDITEGDVEQPSETIYSQFGSQYVVTDLKHKDFLRRAEDDAGLREVYRDSEAAIFELIQ
jgi:hypothetical protein